MHDIITNDEEKANLLEHQIMTTLDTFFNAWIKQNGSSEVSVAETALAGQHKSAITSWNDLWSAIESERNWNFLDYFQEYLAVAWSVSYIS